MIVENFDFRNPDYASVFRRRAEVLHQLRQSPDSLAAFKAHYKNNIADFISDWGMTLEPKNIERGLPVAIPFILFDKQIDFTQEVIGHWHNSKPLLVEKTRQMGFSWLSIAIACSLCLFNDGIMIGFGSRKEEYVDRIGDNKSLFQRARYFLGNIPSEFRGSWDIKKHAPHMRILFPETNASITGEVGDNIGRGNSTSIYFVDESAHLERPDLVDAALSQTTNCRIDISTPNGMANSFAQRRHGGKIDVFSMHWTDDPRKDQAWYEKQCHELPPHVVAQEIDVDYSASVEGVVIPASWVRAAIDAHIKLGIVPSGSRTGALDVADEGSDNNAFCGRHGILLEKLDEWSGKNSTIFKTTERAINLAGQYGCSVLQIDKDGLGAGSVGDAEEIKKRSRIKMEILGYRGSESPVDPDKEWFSGRKNADYFRNKKAQSWWHLRALFENTYNWVVEGKQCDPEDIISIDSRISSKTKLVSELSQATYCINQTGKIEIDKSPNGTKSPNLADSVVMCYSKTKASGFAIDRSYLTQLKKMGRTR